MAIDTTKEKFSVLGFGNWLIPTVPISDDGLDSKDSKWFLHGFADGTYGDTVVIPPPVEPPPSPGSAVRKTFLELCNSVCAEAGIAGGDNAMVTTVGQVGQLGRIVRYVKQAWVEIQNIHQHSGLHWRWMRSQFSITTVVGQNTYSYNGAGVLDALTAAAIYRFRNWMILDYNAPPKVYRQDAGLAGQGWLQYLDWDSFSYLYRIGAANPGQPAHITINPQNQIVLGPTPNAVYVVTGDYMRGAQHFFNDTDTADLPVDFEEVIVYKALSKYGIQKNAVEAVTAGEDGYATYIGMLESDQLSEIHTGCALA